MPQILSPTELPGLRPGDLVRITVVSQPGTSTTVTVTVDGRALVGLDSAPFSFTVPRDGLGPGDHVVELRASGPAGSSARTFPLAIARPAGSSSALAYGVIAVCALAGLAAALGALWWLAGRVRRRDRHEVRALAGLGWLRHRGSPPESDAMVAAAPGEDAPWGEIEVLSGPAAGTRFALRAERELLGSGKFCSIRVGDSSLAAAHAVLSRDGIAIPSTPECALSVGGRLANSVELRPGTEFQAASVLLRFEAAATPIEVERGSSLPASIT